MKEISIYANGPVYCSVCVPKEMNRGEVVANVNLENPSGTTNGWTISKETFADGTPNPAPCKDDNTKIHYLMVY